MKKGVNFLFTIAPNKNSLYGDNMPYYDKPEGNRMRQTERSLAQVG